MKFYAKFEIFLSANCVKKCLQNGGHRVHTLNILNHIHTFHNEDAYYLEIQEILMMTSQMKTFSALLALCETPPV